MTDPGTPSYQIEPRHKFFEAIRRMNRFEHRPGHTVSFVSEVDLTQIEQLRQLRREKRPSYTALVAKAVAIALREFPYANRRVCRRVWLPFGVPRLQSFLRCDVAIAIERNIPGAEGMANVDVLRDADQLTLTAMTEWLRALGEDEENEQWREFSWIIERLPQWLSTLLIRLPYFLPGLWVKYRGGAVLISSPAKYGVDVVVAAWSWPIGISFGLVKQRPIVRDGEIVACPTFHLTLNFDRRIMAGAQAARFFKRIVDILENAGAEMTPFLDTANRGEHSEQSQPTCS